MASPPRILEDVLTHAHRLLAAAIGPGDVAVDATVGNGHDTLHLARCVGPTGHVIGFDVQEAAIQRTRERLEVAGCADRVTLLHAGHEMMAEAIPATLREQAETGVAAICFNLGYLPGGDKALITQPETTVEALAGVLELLRLGGVLTVVCYPRHPGGAVERDAVVQWAEGLMPDEGRVLHYRFLHRPKAPALVAVERCDPSGS